MFKTILLAYDDSSSAEAAFKAALDLAKANAARLTVLSVARPPKPPEDVETRGTLETAEELYGRIHKELKDRAIEAGVEATFRVLVGPPGDRIVTLAQDIGADLIVTGHRVVKSFFGRLLVGSVAKQVITHAHCAVLVVR